MIMMIMIMMSGEGHMKRHIAKHSKEKLLMCDKCEFSGRTNESLKRHMERHDQTMIMTLREAVLQKIPFFYEILS